MPKRPHTGITGVPIRGGMNTVVEAPQLPPGAFSLVKNMRPGHPGFTKRPGQRAQHSIANGTTQVKTMYQFRKNRIDETHLFAQFSDNKIYEASNNPPAITTGVFGNEVYDGSNGQLPASWSNLQDIMVMSNGIDQHKLYAGDNNYVQALIVYKETVAAPVIPDKGLDYTDEATDGRTSTLVVLDALGSNANNCVFVCCPVPASKLTFTITTPNSNAATATVSCRTTVNAWTNVSATDGTADGGATLAQTGVMSWTPNASEIPTYMYGVCGFWYRVTVSSALSASVKASKVTYGNSSFVSLQNVWDGLPPYSIEIFIYDNSEDVYLTQGSGATDLGAINFDNNDEMYVSSVDQLCGLYIDPGGAPNKGAATTISSVEYFNGTTWATAANLNDDTIGFSKAGWVTWDRPSGEHKQHFMSTQYYAYWYRVKVDAAVSDDVVMSIMTMPYYSIDEVGSSGISNCSWGDHMCYSFDRWGQYVYISALGKPMTLNGLGYGVLEAGDGRSNRVLAMNRFHNEMLVWQEEKGVEGGCTTLFEGYNPNTYGVLLLSSKVGIVNAKAHVVVDGVLTSTATEERLRTLAFWISRYGICVTDGRTVAIISDAVQNYFDPLKTECITRGAENQHWISHDSSFNLLRIGLATSGSTTPNKFFAFDLTDKVWYEDAIGQPLSCAAEIDASSGDSPTIQLGGGVADGIVYQLNYGNTDVAVPIESIIDIEFSNGGEVLMIDELLFRCKVQNAGNMLLSLYTNKVAVTEDEPLPMVAENSGEVIRRHVVPLNTQDQHITIRLKHSADQNIYLYDMGVRMYIWELR